MHISIRKLRTIAMLGIALVGGSVLAVGTNDVSYREPFTNEVFVNTYAITNANGWSAGPQDLSTITNLSSGYSLDNMSFPITNAGYDHAVDNKVLNLNTDVAMLTNTLGGATFATSPMYVDTMVKFVASDGFPAAVSNDANVKAAVFVNETSNLVVYCGAFFDGNFLPSKFVTTDTQVVPGTWYRLTVTMDNLDLGEGGHAQAFEVRINNEPVYSSEAYSNDWKDVIFTESFVPAGDGQWFLSAANKPTDLGNEPGKTVIEALAFQGTGMIDDLVVSADVPVYAGVTWFEITQSIGAGGSAAPSALSIPIMLNGSTQIVYTADQYFQISALTTNLASVAAATGLSVYTQDFNSVQGNVAVDVTFVRPTRTIAQTVGANGSGNANPPGTGNILIPNGASTTITYTAANTWYTNTVTAGAYGVAAGNGTSVSTLTFTEVLANTTADAVFTEKATGLVVPMVPSSYGLAQGVSAEWAAANPDAMQEGYMLNIAPTTNAVVAITAINVNGSNLKVLVELNTNNVPIDTTIFGTLKVNSTTNLTVGFTTAYTYQLTGASFTNGGMHEAIFTDADATKFYEALITLP